MDEQELARILQRQNLVLKALLLAVAAELERLATQHPAQLGVLLARAQRIRQRVHEHRTTRSGGDSP